VGGAEICAYLRHGHLEPLQTNALLQEKLMYLTEGANAPFCGTERLHCLNAFTDAIREVRKERPRCKVLQKLQPRLK
jgi:hypothetical protein